MVEIYDSHEQSERVKGWLAENGGAIVMGLVLAFGSLFGFKQWQLWEQGRDQQASAEYQQMSEFLEEDNLDAAVANFETLKAEYESSAYTSLAALQMAGARVKAGQTELAVGLLEQVMNNGKPKALRSVARERLVRVKLALGETDAALSLMDAAQETEGYEARFAELRGDIARRNGDFPSAVDHYAQALELLEEGTGDRSFIEVKMHAASVAAGDGGDAS
ncbi:MAG: tetratricopeptide repeat protein [Xanthomonadales bacterium]|nr:tetratricopeptide repeat protein [Xanthomonadales bacterium]